MSAPYFGSFSNYDSIAEEFLRQGYRDPIVRPPEFPANDQILFASYGGASYEGDALVIYERAGTLYEVHGSHCSCYGLEGQWEPEATTWGALAMRVRPGTSHYNYLYEHDADAVAAYWALVDARVETK